MRDKAGRAARGIDIPVEIIDGRAEMIPLPDGSVDTVVLTFTLCTIPDWRTGLQEVKRVLKRNGRLVFCEHGLAPAESSRVWQKRINPCWKKIAGGCNLDRPIPDMISDVGLEVEALKEEYVPGMPKFAGFVYRGTACKIQA
jgi:SAM-dependent methyltransferase